MDDYGNILETVAGWTYCMWLISTSVYGGRMAFTTYAHIQDI